MNVEEYKELINDCIKNPDNSCINLKNILDKIEEDNNTYNAQTKTIEEQNKKIRDLQDTNMKLFLSQTGARTGEEQEQEELTGQAALDEFINNLGKE